MYSIQRFLILTAVLLLLSGCAPAPNNSNTVSVNPTPSPSASPSPSPATSETASVPVTLPLLDALLSDEKFVGQVKSKLKLTDDQVTQLKQASSTEIDRLRETNAEDVDGTSATDARTRATEQLRTIIGEEKSKQLTSLANDYWSKGDVTAGTEDKNQPQMLPGPNAVPKDTRIVVNIPAFRMDLFQDGSLVKTYKIGIGYPEFPLPMGLRKANQIIFNPTWTPPDSPWVAKMKNVTAGETVKAGDKDNPLGPIKIPIGLPSLIHGGKSPAKIGKFASHGCVGLTTAQVKDFAALLARASNTNAISQQTIDSYLKDRERTQTVKLNQTVPVELRYETIVLEDGKLHIYKDVYAQDTNTEENLRQVLSAQGVKFEDLSEQQRTDALNALNAMSANPKAAPSPSPEASPGKKTARVKKPAKPQNEIVIDLGSVAQKGYPAPVNEDIGRR
ncbi:MAG TPA: L,D-transpeptidase family protein [Pyrinomonadaceae bacterium]|nr:L,D-transpeptidase family protein [Pyrinomonadaceae bacterium]